METTINIEADCFICFETMEEKTLLTCCKHSLHSKCLFLYIIGKHIEENKITCPMCRQQLRLQDYFTTDSFTTYMNSLSTIDFKAKYIKLNCYKCLRMLCSKYIVNVCGIKIPFVNLKLIFFVLYYKLLSNIWTILLIVTLYSLMFILIHIEYSLKNMARNN